MFLCIHCLWTSRHDWPNGWPDGWPDGWPGGWPDGWPDVSNVCWDLALSVVVGRHRLHQRYSRLWLRTICGVGSNSLTGPGHGWHSVQYSYSSFLSRVSFQSLGCCLCRALALPIRLIKKSLALGSLLPRLSWSNLMKEGLLVSFATEWKDSSCTPDCPRSAMTLYKDWICPTIKRTRRWILFLLQDISSSLPTYSPEAVLSLLNESSINPASSWEFPSERSSSLSAIRVAVSRLANEVDADVKRIALFQSVT